jgi:hypothetical protein
MQKELDGKVEARLNDAANTPSIAGVRVEQSPVDCAARRTLLKCIVYA